MLFSDYSQDAQISIVHCCVIIRQTFRTSIIHCCVIIRRAFRTVRRFVIIHQTLEENVIHCSVIIRQRAGELREKIQRFRLRKHFFHQLQDYDKGTSVLSVLERVLHSM